MILWPSPAPQIEQSQTIDPTEANVYVSPPTQPGSPGSRLTVNPSRTHVGRRDATLRALPSCFRGVALQRAGLRRTSPVPSIPRFSPPSWRSRQLLPPPRPPQPLPGSGQRIGRHSVRLRVPSCPASMCRDRMRLEDARGRRCHGRPPSARLLRRQQDNAIREQRGRGCRRALFSRRERLAARHLLRHPHRPHCFVDTLPSSPGPFPSFAAHGLLPDTINVACHGRISHNATMPPVSPSVCRCPSTNKRHVFVLRPISQLSRHIESGVGRIATCQGLILIA